MAFNFSNFKFSFQNYYENTYDRVPVEVKSETISGDVFYLPNVLELGKYLIKAGSKGTVEKVTILDESGNVLTESEGREMIYGFSR